MVRNLLFICLSLLMSSAYVFSQGGQGSVKGSLIDADNGDAIYGASVELTQNGTRKGIARTDFDGAFRIGNLQPGSYVVEFKATGFNTQKIEGVVISSDKITFFDETEMVKTDDMQDLPEVTVIKYVVPLIDKDGGASGRTVKRRYCAIASKICGRCSWNRWWG